METLKDVWESQGLSGAEVARQANISYPTLLRVARKDRSVSVPVLVRVCHVLQISVDYYQSLEATK